MENSWGMQLPGYYLHVRPWYYIWASIIWVRIDLYLVVSTNTGVSASCKSAVTISLDWEQRTKNIMRRSFFSILSLWAQSFPPTPVLPFLRYQTKVAPKRSGQWATSCSFLFCSLLSCPNPMHRFSFPCQPLLHCPSNSSLLPFIAFLFFSFPPLSFPQFHLPYLSQGESKPRQYYFVLLLFNSAVHTLTYRSLAFFIICVHTSWLHAMFPRTPTLISYKECTNRINIYILYNNYLEFASAHQKAHIVMTVK